MVKLPGVIAKDTMSAMVKFAEMFQESSLDFISYDKCSLLLSSCMQDAIHDISFEEKGGIASRDQCEAVSKKQDALREAAAAEQQQKIADEALEHQAEDRGRDSCRGSEKPG